jgi:hypothetical protein
LIIYFFVAPLLKGKGTGGKCTSTLTPKPRPATQKPKAGAVKPRPIPSSEFRRFYDRGDLRELTVTGQTNVKKRVVLQAAGFNLGLVMRKLMGAGTPKRMAAALVALLAAILTFIRRHTTTNAANGRNHHNRSWWTPTALTQRTFA